MTKYYKTDIPTKIINCYYGTRQSGKTYFEHNKIKKTKEDKKIEKLDLEELNKLLNGSSDFYVTKHIIHKALVETKSKINEIIDKISGE